MPDKFYTRDRGNFDKGHIVRRDDVAWGEDYDEVRRANGDTYHVTNCSPQVDAFNRSNLRGDWGKLENYNNVFFVYTNNEHSRSFRDAKMRE